MKAMILAAGRGERMMPLTANRPKPLIKVGNQTLIEYAINALKKAGITDIVINIAYLAEQIKSYLGDGSSFGVKIQYSNESNKALETAGGIIKALPLLGSEPFLVINSDIICDYDLSQITLPKNSLAHLVLINNPQHHLNGDFSIIDNQQLTLASDKSLTFSGMGIYHPYFFKSYQNYSDKLALYPLLKEAINNQQLSGEHYLGNWHDVGTPKRLQLAVSHSNLNLKFK